MSLKTILVHLSDDDLHAERLEVAGRLARDYDAHLVALFMATPIGMPAEVIGRGAAAAYLNAATTAVRDKALALKEDFAGFCLDQGISSSWIVEEGDHLELLAQHAHAADLIVVSQPRIESIEDRFRLRLAEEITMVAGLPILLLPQAHAAESLGRRVLIAWKGTREAVRAVRDALPVLESARETTVLTVSPDSEDRRSQKEVVAYLARHGIAASAQEAAEENGVGQAILDSAAARGCDLIVMGAYGHSRLRELVMGGVTRHVLYNTAVPVFMSH